jgi:hypothetical protein
MVLYNTKATTTSDCETLKGRSPDLNSHVPQIIKTGVRRLILSCTKKPIVVPLISPVEKRNSRKTTIDITTIPYFARIVSGNSS